MTRKCFGQVFITNKSQQAIRNKMIGMIDTELADNIIEIGFGHLFLTEKLFMFEDKKLWLFEIDNKIYRQYYDHLSSLGANTFNVDFVEFIKNQQLNKEIKFNIISNIAFNIFKATMTNIVLAKYNNIMQMVILICKNIGLSVIAQDSAFAKFFSFFYKSKIHYLSQRTNYSTKLKVETCLLDIRPNTEIYHTLKDIDLCDLYSFIKLLFLNKRKKLKHNKNIDAKYYNIEELRAHQLTSEQIMNLYDGYKAK